MGDEHEQQPLRAGRPSDHRQDGTQLQVPDPEPRLFVEFPQAGLVGVFVRFDLPSGRIEEPLVGWFPPAEEQYASAIPDEAERS